MSTYRNTRCPYCGQILSLNERSEFYDYNRYIGLSYERCPNCNKIYSTNKKLYSDMNKNEKSQLSACYFFNIISTSFTLYAISIILLILINSFVGNIANTISMVFLLPILPCIALGFIISKKNYNYIIKLTINDFNIDLELKNINSNNTNNDLINKKL